MRDANGRFVKGEESIFFGRKHTPEARQLQSIAHKGKPITWNTGHPHTPEAREKIRLANLRRYAGHIRTTKVSKPRVLKTAEELLARKRFRNQRYKAVKRNAMGSHTFEQWQELKEKYNFMCLCCKQFEPMIKLTEDHIVPLSLGGSDNIENIQPLCVSCNVRKHATFISYLPTKNSITAET